MSADVEGDTVWSDGEARVEVAVVGGVEEVVVAEDIGTAKDKSILGEGAWAEALVVFLFLPSSLEASVTLSTNANRSNFGSSIRKNFSRLMPSPGRCLLTFIHTVQVKS